MFAAVLDFFDGFFAKILNVHSALGKQLDSLADLVSFGLAPAIIIYVFLGELQTSNIPSEFKYLKLSVLLIPLFSAIRLAKFNIDVVDLHDVLRTKIMKILFKFHGINTITFEKGRKEKKQLISGEIPFKALPHISKRYFDAFNSLVKNKNLNNGPWINKSETTPITIEKNAINIGIAPFAAHKSKEWGIHKIEKLICQYKNHKILLFGGGEIELKKIELLEKKYKNCISVAGKYTLKDELSIISNLSLMICMDSANMHLADLTGIPVVSIWGPTHHYLGFGPLNNLNNIVEIPKELLPCRPCSVYGKIKSEIQRSCAKESMEKISVQQVIDKINPLIEL